MCREKFLNVEATWNAKENFARTRSLGRFRRGCTMRTRATAAATTTRKKGGRGGGLDRPRYVYRRESPLDKFSGFLISESGVSAGRSGEDARDPEEGRVRGRNTPRTGSCIMYSGEYSRYWTPRYTGWPLGRRYTPPVPAFIEVRKLVATVGSREPLFAPGGDASRGILV